MSKTGSRLSPAKIRNVRVKIRARVKENKDLQAAVDAIVSGARPTDRESQRRAKKFAYSTVVSRNKFLKEAAKKIFESEEAR
jgi:hypothetical protein